MKPELGRLEAESRLLTLPSMYNIMYLLHLVDFNSKCREIYHTRECYGLCGAFASGILALLVVIYVAISSLQ